MTDQRNDKVLIYEASTFVDHVIGYIVADASATFKMLVVTVPRGKSKSAVISAVTVSPRGMLQAVADHWLPNGGASAIVCNDRA